jgi:hypothetical protein
MPRKGVFPALQADDGFIPIPSDTVNVKDDDNNPQAYEFVFLHNPDTAAAITVRVLPAASDNDDDLAVTIAIPACGVFPLAVKRIYATTPTVAEGDVIALASGQR